MPDFDSILDASNPVSPLSVPASQTAVLLLDYHRNFFGRVGEERAPRVLAGALGLRAWARENNVLVIHGLVDLAGAVFPTFKNQAMAASFRAMIEADPTSADEHPELVSPDPEQEPTVKRTAGIVSAMKSNGLPELLKKHGIRSLVMGGIATGGCVLRTSFAAADDGYFATVVEDACADPDPAIHDVLVAKILRTNVHIVSLAEWQAEWAKAHPK